MVFSLVLSLLQVAYDVAAFGALVDEVLVIDEVQDVFGGYLFDKADEVIEPERAPTAGIDVVVAEGVLGRECFGIHTAFGHVLSRDEGRVEGTACFPDVSVFLEVREAIDGGSEVVPEGFEPPRIFECVARVEGSAT